MEHRREPRRPESDSPWLPSLAIGFLVLQGIGVLAWWMLLLLVPATRAPFLAPGAPDATLFAFLCADLVVYAGAGLAAAYGLARRRAWAWGLLCADTGAVAYAGLYALLLPVVSGGGWLGAVLMAPSLIVLPGLAWCLRPVSQA